MKLDEFIAKAAERKWPNNAHVKEPGFKTLYVRYTMRCVEGTIWDPVLDLSNIEASRKGKGTFKRLIKHLREAYPDLALYVENVITTSFQEGLERMGFRYVGPTKELPCYFLPPEKKHDRSKVCEGL